MLNILSVEDDHVIAKCIKQYFEEICGNYQVTSIDHGDLAFDTLSNPHSFDCIILDLKMPEWNGETLYRSIEANKICPGIEGCIHHRRQHGPGS